jgi:hypothetical protein
MARQQDVIGERTHERSTTYRSWLRKIGAHTYRFDVKVSTSGRWDVRVDRSEGWGPGRAGWVTVHQWPVGNEDEED